MRFSQRTGKTEVQETIQSDFMTSSFRNRLFNLIFIEYIELITINKEINLMEFELQIKFDFLKKYNFIFGKVFRGLRADIFTNEIKTNFLSGEEYNTYFIYDFLELFVQYIGSKISADKSDKLVKEINNIFELEKSAYRFGKDKKLIPITDEIEINELNKESGYAEVDEHLEKAKKFFSNREKPDYKKTISESVNAIETMCRIILNDNDITLGNALKKIDGLDPQFKKISQAMYSFSSSFGGIRHGNKPNKNNKISEDEARFILVTSYSVVNYLKSKFLVNQV